MRVKWMEKVERLVERFPLIEHSADLDALAPDLIAELERSVNDFRLKIMVVLD